MKDFFTAFLERFKHPILYSVITALVVHNFDQIYYLAISPFHYTDMKPYDVMKRFIDLLADQRCERVWEPIILGGIFGTLILPIVDVFYSTLIAFAMSIKEKGVNWSKKSSWSIKINDARQIGQCLAESWEDSELWIGMDKLTFGSKCYLFRCSPHVTIRDVVVYNKKNNRVEHASGINDKLLGIVYQVFYLNLALVVTEGTIIDSNFINTFKKGDRENADLNLASSGKLRAGNLGTNDSNLIATIKSLPSDKTRKEITLVKSNLDIEAVTLPIEKRLFGEVEVKLGLF
ncbi:hypothetical protein [Leptospira sarikeiensis]|uniref:Uncharacterized protein n=1 Tax=Leptospira sarikeiensis TaxID=2484943 RepID=A0A4R9K4U3_9LEPT|nr:hypothetical protein [Leptospira sarikeiensis]TGL61172.1 hypothetical protein EHQ64_11185 [Leptospira sarikeiensis]